MNERALRVYLDEHLTGASTVTMLVERRIGDGLGPPWLERFRDQLDHERRVVEAVAERLDATVGVPVHAAGLLAETGVRGALRLTQRVHPALRDLLEFELLFVGVQGKAALWRALRVHATHPAVRGTDLDGLEEQAYDQAAQLDSLRLAAMASLGDATT